MQRRRVQDIRVFQLKTAASLHVAYVVESQLLYRTVPQAELAQMISMFSSVSARPYQISPYQSMRLINNVVIEEVIEIRLHLKPARRIEIYHVAATIMPLREIPGELRLQRHVGEIIFGL